MKPGRHHSLRRHTPPHTHTHTPTSSIQTFQLWQTAQWGDALLICQLFTSSSNFLSLLKLGNRKRGEIGSWEAVGLSPAPRDKVVMRRKQEAAENSLPPKWRIPKLRKNRGEIYRQIITGIDLSMETTSPSGFMTCCTLGTRSCFFFGAISRVEWLPWKSWRKKSASIFQWVLASYQVENWSCIHRDRLCPDQKTRNTPSATFSPRSTDETQGREGGDINAGRSSPSWRAAFWYCWFWT